MDVRMVHTIAAGESDICFGDMSLKRNVDLCQYMRVIEREDSFGQTEDKVTHVDKKVLPRYGCRERLGRHILFVGRVDCRSDA